MKQHNYEVCVNWTGNDGEGTSTYRSYRRDYTILSDGKPEIHGSSDPSFRGDRSRHNPEELLVASVSSCHMLWYLHLCAVNHIAVLEYRDLASGLLEEDATGSGEFVRVVLKPKVKISVGGDQHKAATLHAEAHRLCFIARSVKFPVDIEPEIEEAEASPVR